MDSIFSKLQSVTENYYSGLSDMSIVPKKTVEEIKNYLKNLDTTELQEQLAGLDCRVFRYTLTLKSSQIR